MKNIVKNERMWGTLFIVLAILIVILVYVDYRLLNYAWDTAVNDQVGAAYPAETLPPKINPEDENPQGGIGPGDGSGPGLPDSTATPNLPTPEPWNGKGRVTILVLGLDYADWESADRMGPPRSDTMILFTIDPASKTAGILSIPRDLWVTMPGIEGEHKINTAHRFGELYKMPGGGPGLAVRTVEKLLEVPINFYAVVDFYAFQDLIDEIGGVEVDVPGEIKVDPIGPGNTVVLQPGKQLLDGPTALAYARNRSTSGDETDRARRQQQVIMAIREKVLGLDKLPRLILKAPYLYNSLGKGIRTNMSLEQAIQLAWLAQKISPEDIQRANIGDKEVMNDVSEDGQAIFVPIMDRVLALRDKLFTSSTSGSSEGLSAEELVAAENSRIKIINQTGDPALGELTATYLRENGLNVIQIEENTEIRLKTRLVDHVGDPNTFRYLINLLNIAPSETYINIDMPDNLDMEVFLGVDWVQDNPLQK